VPDESLIQTPQIWKHVCGVFVWKDFIRHGCGEHLPAGRDLIRLAFGDPPSPKGKVCLVVFGWFVCCFEKAEQQCNQCVFLKFHIQDGQSSSCAAI